MPPKKLPPIARIVAASSNSAWIVIAAAVALCVLATAYTKQHFAMTTDTLELTAPDLPWRRSQAAFNDALPQQKDLIVAVVEGATPELAENAAAALAAALSKRPDLFKSVRRPDGGPFFSREGLLFLSSAQLKALTEKLIAEQPFLAPLAADPSLRGVMHGLSTALVGVEQGQAQLDDLVRPMRQLADAFGLIVKGEPAFFSWRTLISDEPAGLRETRRFILLQPMLDNSLLMPAEPAVSAIRQAAHNLALAPATGVRVRLTGSVVLADDQFATLAERAGLMATAMLGGVILMLWLAVRSFRLIACILVTTIVGLALTASLGLVMVGRFNLISVAFIPLFVGLGIDFAIQFSVRYRAERVVHCNPATALAATGAAVGGSLALAAAATAIGFLAFVPTAYLGASELGLIAGVGMLVAFLLSVTLLPALLIVIRPKGQTEAIGLPGLAPLDRFLVNRRRLVLAVFGSAAVICLALLPMLRFDFNPLHLMNPKLESVSTLLDLMSDPDATPNTIEFLAPSLAAADELAGRLAALPEVSRVVTLSSFVPGDQPAKLAVVRDAASLIDLMLNPIEVKPPPTDGEIADSLVETATALRRAATEAHDPAAEDARRLAALLDQLATGNAQARVQASESLVVPLDTLLAQMRALFQPEPVTVQSLPSDLVHDWVARNGEFRVQAAPKGDPNDNRTLTRFSRAVQSVARGATGAPITTQEAAGMIVTAFIHAGIWSLLAITALLLVVLRRGGDVILTLIPILLAGLLTLASCVVIGEPLDFANIIALPLLFGIGVAFNIYFVFAWRSGQTNLLQSSLARAVLFSGLTTGTAFGNLLLSSHPGTAGLGRLLAISLGWTLVVALLFEPALLGRPQRGS
jgi:hopanoid biosynthesis associated RND transporter like protein HpnN